MKHPSSINLFRLALACVWGGGLLLLTAGRANAGIVLSNLEGNRTGTATSIIANGANFRGKGVAFAVGSSDLQLESVSLSLKFTSLAVTPSISLYSSSGSTVPATSLLAFTNPVFATGATFNDYTFTPASGFTLVANTTYWITVQATGNATDTTLQWASSSPSLTPTSVGGLATHVTQKFGPASSTNPATWTSSSSVINSYALSASVLPIPEPSTYAFVAGALALGLVPVRRRA